MRWLIKNMKWVMLLSGVLTCTMLYAAIAPNAALESTFGDRLQGPTAEIVVRNWGVLITLMGVMLIYGALKKESRPFVLTIVGISKVAFIGLVLGNGTRYLANQAGIAIALDTVMVALYVVYLIGSRNEANVLT